MDADIIRGLSLKNDKHLNAAWEAYTVLKSADELADTFNVLCDVKRDQYLKQKQEETSKQPEG